MHAETCGRDGVIASVRVLIAGGTFLLDVGYFAIRGDFPVVAGNTPATESRESQETNQTVHCETPNTATSNSCTADFLTPTTLRIMRW